MEILEAAPASRVLIKIDFEKPFQAHNQVDFALTSEGGGTRVVWSMTGPQAFMMKVMCLFMSMDRMVGGDFEKAALLSKKALLRPVGSPNPKLELASLEMDLLKTVNRTGIGPEGLGGKVTAMAVHVESFPCHIASLPVAVNINCHAARHKTIIL